MGIAILEEISSQHKRIASIRKRVVAREKEYEKENPDFKQSGWTDTENLTPLQLFIEHRVTNGLGYYDSFYWCISAKPSEYSELTDFYRKKEAQQEWSRLGNPSQFPIVPPITSKP